MREIKFRAWNVLKNKWDTFNGQELNQTVSDVGSLPTTISLGEYGSMGRDTHLIYCQYTGLHDNKGVDIYEGDIVTYGYRYGDEASKYCRVEWDSNNLSWGALFDKSQCHHLTRDDWTNLEVIGNIYESPELLNGSTNE